MKGDKFICALSDIKLNLVENSLVAKVSWGREGFTSHKITKPAGIAGTHKTHHFFKLSISIYFDISE
jgi:hypothetical protein